MPISFIHSQLCCLWSKRLGPIILSLVLIFGLLCVHKFYIYRVIRKQVYILEADLVDFDQAVRDKNNLISEKKRLEQKLDYFHMQKSTQCHDLATYLLDIANLMPAKLVLSKIELIVGDKIIIEGFGNSPDQIISFWHKLSSLDYVINGKLDAIKAEETNRSGRKKKSLRNQFSLQLKVKNYE